MKLTHQRLLSLISYNPQTGEFFWRAGKRRAGTFKSEGYQRLQINKQYYYGHRLAWFYMTAEWPPSDIDHQNRNPSDNRWQNLRLASQGQNNINSKTRKTNSTGFRGVSCRRGKYRARVYYQGKEYHLGDFKTAREAHAAYRERASLFYRCFVPGAKS